jgi:hypothetical protein
MALRTVIDADGYLCHHVRESVPENEADRAKNRRVGKERGMEGERI